MALLARIDNADLLTKTADFSFLDDAIERLKTQIQLTNQIQKNCDTKNYVAKNCVGKNHGKKWEKKGKKSYGVKCYLHHYRHPIQYLQMECKCAENADTKQITNQKQREQSAGHILTLIAKNNYHKIH